MAFPAQGDVEHFANGAFVIADQNISHANLPRPRRPRAIVRPKLASSPVGRPLGIKPAQAQHKCGSLPWLGARPYLALMRLHDLVHDRQSQPGSAFEVRLERFEDLFRLLRASCPLRYRQTRPASRRPQPRPLTVSVPPSFMARTAFSQRFQNTCFNLSPSARAHACFTGKRALDRDAGILCLHAVIHQRQSVFHQLNEIDLRRSDIAWCGNRPENP